jgi:hypothetical protein
VRERVWFLTDIAASRARTEVSVKKSINKVAIIKKYKLI